jgi:hypothetical protein
LIVGLGAPARAQDVLSKKLISGGIETGGSSVDDVDGSRILL